MENQRKFAVINRSTCGVPATAKRQKTASRIPYSLSVIVDEDASWESLDEVLLTLFNLDIKVLRVCSCKGCLDVLVAPDTSLFLIDALNQQRRLGEFYSFYVSISEKEYRR